MSSKPIRSSVTELPVRKRRQLKPSTEKTISDLMWLNQLRALFGTEPTTNLIDLSEIRKIRTKVTLPPLTPRSVFAAHPSVLGESHELHEDGLKGFS